ncbi:citryl-CoA lyase [Verminephrobacter eiseniae]|uniref:citrate synthase (unknown stereospecificity) n=1 Tax=Verminephrobacter eiseniae (strain EF01-2) TaxID=391735 RepID=A1WJF4_VEREI|nr:citryl-CoA lyase [Verminephrobacter eiseniae]ABM57761.1 citrate synthase [Verminephrobacter eiseniae EF01-2]MCW5229823.1 citryl-CoA lyase [Verminephrobacter eiseniae]MCW5236691.1 citryl-CoA lyase [Verminephrobacter eiseniae]MCW5263574.1 citryl-CoA lyase [Verminephrobacter eiseniae]MCW5283373.1 citryl-CoA lyase [Verminephrobacter eiseniae]
MSKIKKSLHTELGHSTPDKITVRGRDLPSEILGHFNLGDMAFLELTGRAPTPQQSVTFNAILVTLVEHGITPSALVARLTYAGAPESLQAAVAAGLCGLGSVFVGSTEGAARMLYQAIAAGSAPTQAPDVLARAIVADHRSRKEIVPGLGHPLHKPIDPRTPRLFQIAAENGLSGHYVALMQAVQSEAERVSGKSLPINATGAIGAIACEFGFPWRIIRGLGVMARAVGLVGHILEEIDDPMGVEIWQRVEREAGGPRQDG